jgi:hypothetical protein
VNPVVGNDDHERAATAGGQDSDDSGPGDEHPR